MNKWFFILISVVFFISANINAYAQSVVETKGVVVDESGEAIIGASILLKGTQQGVITDVDGKFSLKTKKGDVLVVSFVGMKTQEIIASEKMSITLKSNVKELEQVVVTAYGTSKKSAITGSATNIKSDNISIKAPTELSKGLVGEVAGVQIINSTGKPGDQANIYIRGLASLNASSSPLFVINGVPQSAFDISSLSPNDIESYTILKDASASALYGSRAAGGVILITTKKGSSGDIKVDADVVYGINKRVLPLYDNIKSPEEYIETVWSSLYTKQKYNPQKNSDGSIQDPAEYASQNLYTRKTGDGKYTTLGISSAYNIWDKDGTMLIDPKTQKFRKGIKRRYTPENWENSIFRIANKISSNIRLSSGNDVFNQYTSVGFSKDQGYYIESDFSRFNILSNFTYNINNWIKFDGSLLYSKLKYDDPGQGRNSNNGFLFVNTIPPIYGVYLRDEKGNKVKDEIFGGYKYDYGNENFDNSGRDYANSINPAFSVLKDKSISQSDQISFSGNLEIKFSEYLNLSINNSYNKNNDVYSQLTNPYYGDGLSAGGRISKINSFTENIFANQILNFNKSFNDIHSIKILLGHEISAYTNSDIDSYKNKLLRPDGIDLSNAIIRGDNSGSTSKQNIESYFINSSYEYNNKYFLSASVRADGSSRFAKGHRWGKFGQIGAAWVMSNEEFFKPISNSINYLKLKAGIGSIGNQSIQDFAYVDLYNLSNVNDNFSFIFSQKGNKNITWEKSNEFSMGLEMSILNKIEFNFSFFNKAISNLIYSKGIAPSLGYTSILSNDGAMRNRGIEFDFKIKAIETENASLKIKLNGTSYTSTITKLPIDEGTGREKDIDFSGNFGRRTGHSIFDYFMREYAGVNKETGEALYKQYFNVNQDGTKDQIRQLIDKNLYRNINNEIVTKINKLEEVTTTNGTEATLKYVGKTNLAKLSGGFGFEFNYKKFFSSLTFIYSLGGYTYDGTYAEKMGNPQNGSSTWNIDIRKRWKKPGDITNVPRINDGFDQFTNSNSDRFLTSKNYLSLSSISLGYSFGQISFAKNVTLTLSSDNLFMLTARKGFYPISGLLGGTSSTQYIPVTTFTAGLKANF